MAADPAVVHSVTLHPVRVGLYALWAASVVWFARAILASPARGPAEG